MNKSTRNNLIGAGIASSAIAAFGAVSHTVTKKLISVGMDRQAPAKFAEARPKFNRSPALQGAMVQLDAIPAPIRVFLVDLFILAAPYLCCFIGVF